MRGSGTCGSRCALNQRCLGPELPDPLPEGVRFQDPPSPPLPFTILPPPHPSLLHLHMARGSSYSYPACGAKRPRPQRGAQRAASAWEEKSSPSERLRVDIPALSFRQAVSPSPTSRPHSPHSAAHHTCVARISRSFPGGSGYARGTKRLHSRNLPRASTRILAEQPQHRILLPTPVSAASKLQPSHSATEVAPRGASPGSFQTADQSCSLRLIAASSLRQRPQAPLPPAASPPLDPRNLVSLSRYRGPAVPPPRWGRSRNASSGTFLTGRTFQNSRGGRGAPQSPSFLESRFDHQNYTVVNSSHWSR